MNPSSCKGCEALADRCKLLETELKMTKLEHQNTIAKHENTKLELENAQLKHLIVSGAFVPPFASPTVEHKQIQDHHSSGMQFAPLSEQNQPIGGSENAFIQQQQLTESVMNQESNGNGAGASLTDN
ncbi:hypothetical protein niasHT_039049 [Heterodera trifolii]|uniref:Uncharacterized protein n=1 Tax=Heterodera trifolii TaxID=157864 RepID=A0ABD2HRP4_9BILA